MYRYSMCGLRFAGMPGFEGWYYNKDAILFAIRRLPQPRDTAEAVKDEVTVSGRIIQRWMDKYPRIGVYQGFRDKWR